MKKLLSALLVLMFVLSAVATVSYTHLAQRFRRSFSGVVASTSFL